MSDGMREILFRGKRTDNGEWVEGYLTRRVAAIQYKAHYSLWFIDKPPRDPDDSGVLYNVDRATVGQFTGLIDKHGDRKFEGDIFKFGDHLYIIEWDDGELAFWANEPFEPDYSVALAEFSADEIEVIGNVHDNPELLR